MPPIALDRLESIGSILIARALHFYHALKRTEKIFAGSLLIATFIGLVSIVLTFFSTVAMLFNFSTFYDWKFLLISFGTLGISGIGLASAGFLPQLTHILLEAISDLADKLDTIPREDEADIKVTLDDGSTCRYPKAKKFVRKKLQSFQGFNILSFFTMHRSILTSILAHFVTYLIVLLQFKISEFGGPND